MKEALDKTVVLPDSIFFKVGNLKGREKISIGLSSFGGHLTITNNGERRVINAHFTYDDPGKPPDHLCELSYFTWARLLVRMKQLLFPTAQQFFFSRKVNIGRLKRHGLLLATGNPGSDVEKALAKVNSKKTRFQSKKEVNLSTFQGLIKYPEDIVTDDAKFYFVFSPNRNAIQGVIFRNPASPGSKSYFFVTTKMLRQFFKGQNYLLYCILTELNFENKEKLLRLFEEKILSPERHNHP